MQTYQVLKIFISSPGDVQEERNIAEDVIMKVNNTCRDTLGIILEASKWEKMPPLTPDLSEEKVQDIINQELRDCQAFVLILYKRYGSVDPAYKKSNTQREVEIAMDMLLRKKKIMFLSYFRNVQPNPDQGPQESAVSALKNDLHKNGMWYRTYDDPTSFRDKFTHELYNTILKFRHSTSKHRALRAFWQLGIIDKNTHPELSIIFPPVDRSFMRQQNPKKFWQERLVPHIVFEDYKAISKIEKTLRLLGLHAFGSYSTSQVPTNLADMNRVWLCVPRNLQAQQQLNLYKTVSRFEFSPRKVHSESGIFWKYSATSNRIEVRSPLAGYLRLQRRKDPGGNWTAEKSRIIAKDFAVIARFSDTTSKQNMYYGSLKDFFIAGIRGLGTWGAAWFIDRRYDHFLKFEKDDDIDIQMLLEVTYKDERIIDARDVSEEPESYFAKQNDPQEIKRIVREYQNSK